MQKAMPANFYLNIYPREMNGYQLSAGMHHFLKSVVFRGSGR